MGTMGMMMMMMLIISSLMSVYSELGFGNFTIITGMVFCDTCKDGVVSLHDYPLSGINITMVCPGVVDDDVPTHYFKTNDFGIYSTMFEGTPEIGKCNARISLPMRNNNSFCMASSTHGPTTFPRLLTPITSDLGTAIYYFDPSITQPMEPLSTCPRSSSPPPPLPPPPSPAILSLGGPPFPDMQKPRSFQNVCPFQYWKKPEYDCYWNTLTPNMTVGYVFGPLAVTRYGTDITLLEALNGRSDPYRTLLRETVTALLNAYNSLDVSFNYADVSDLFDTALVGSNRTVMLIAKKFKDANSFRCKFKPCMPV